MRGARPLFVHTQNALRGELQVRVRLRELEPRLEPRHNAKQLKVAGPGQQVMVTAEVGSFRADESSTATKISIPINEIPQGVGVVNQSQQDIRFGDAAENISGVNRDVLASGDLGGALTIRGLPLGVFPTTTATDLRSMAWCLRIRPMWIASRY
jgi:outer membrane receptor for ferric coprogen and ferric-rhodotorulic acid